MYVQYGKPSAPSGKSFLGALICWYLFAHLEWHTWDSFWVGDSYLAAALSWTAKGAGLSLGLWLNMEETWMGRTGLSLGPRDIIIASNGTQRDYKLGGCRAHGPICSIAPLCIPLVIYSADQCQYFGKKTSFCLWPDVHRFHLGQEGKFLWCSLLHSSFSARTSQTVWRPVGQNQKIYRSLM